MIYSFQQITAIRNYLEKKQEERGDSFKFKLVKHLNHSTSIYIYDEQNKVELELSELTVEMPIGTIAITDQSVFPPVDIRKVTKEEFEEDADYYNDFFKDNSSFEGVTRRLENAFGKYAPVRDPKLPPIVSFYSYKGGVGRTTTLAALASFHARRTGAKVLILDCDFEAPGLVNFFGMNEDDLASKGGIVEYLTDVVYLQDKSKVDIKQYIHTISASASKDPLGYAGDKGTVYIMTAGNVSINSITPETNAPIDLRTHQDHYLHGLARLDFNNADLIVTQFQEMLIQANQAYNPDVILIDSRTGFNDVFNNIVIRLSDVVVGLFGTSKQNVPGLYNFLDTTAAENKGNIGSFEIVLVNSIAPNVRQSFKGFKRQIEKYNADTDSEMNPEIFSIEYIPRIAEIGTPTDDGDILLDYTDPNRYAFPDYQNGKGERLLEYLSNQIEKKNVVIEDEEKKDILITTVLPETIDVNKEIVFPLRDFFNSQNISYAENLGQDRKEFINKFYYFRNYLRDLFLRETFIVRGYKGTGKTLLYHALEDIAFVEKLKRFNDIDEDFRFVNVVNPNNILQLSSLNFNPQNTGEKIQTYYRRFWIVYIWNTLLPRFSELYKSQLSHFEVMSDETTREKFEVLMKTDKILDVEYDLRKLNEILVEKGIKVVISFDYLDKIVATSEWNTNGHPIAQLINFGQAKSYSNFYPKIFIRTDLFHKIQYINNVNALENKVLSLDWTTEELFAYFFKIVYKTTNGSFTNWLLLKNPEKQDYIISIKKIIEDNDAQIPLEQNEILEFLVNNFFGEYVKDDNPNFGRSYEWFHLNLKNANDVISLRPFIALLSFCFEERAKNSNEVRTILPGEYFYKPAAREAAAEAHLTDIWKEYDDEILRVFLETLHKSDNPILERYRHHSILHEDLRLLILKVYELNNLSQPNWDKVQKLIEMLKDAGIIRQNVSYKVSYSFAFLYKFYLRLKGSPKRR